MVLKEKIETFTKLNEKNLFRALVVLEGTTAKCLHHLYAKFSVSLPGKINRLSC